MTNCTSNSVLGINLLVRGVQSMTREGRIQARVFISVQQWLLTKKIKKGNTHVRARARAHAHARTHTLFTRCSRMYFGYANIQAQKYNNPHSVSTHSKNTPYKMAARSPFIELDSSHFRTYHVEVHNNLETKQN